MIRSQGSVDAMMARRAREGHLVFSLAAGATSADWGVSLGGELDWNRVLQIAWEEGATGALSKYFRALPVGLVPREVERQLACLTLERDMRMQTLQSRTRESIAILAAAGIDVALLKGAALATTVYGSFTERPMKDVDLLVAPRDAEAAKRFLLDAGWAHDSELPDDTIYAAHHHLAPLVDLKGSRSRLEIHRELLPRGHPFHLVTDDLWEKAREVEIDGSRVFVLDPNQHALHVAIHFAWSHAMTSGGWNAFRDLDALLRAGVLAWDELVKLAITARASTCCYWTLLLARTVSGLDVPDEVLASLAPRMGRAIRARLLRHFVQVLVRDEATTSSVRLARALWRMAIQPERQGHGGSRPWLSSAELTAARREQGSAQPIRGEAPLPTRMASCAGYVARLVWS